MIIFEDDDLIACFKPPRLPCTPAREQRQHSLKRAIEEYLGKEVHAPSRLDAAAQGLVVMSKSKRMHKHLQQAFERHQVEKYYLAEVSPAVSWHRKLIENQIGREPRHPILRAVVDSGGDPAVSHFTVLYQVPDNPLGGTSVLLAKPRTGRTHQLRVHTAHLGTPIVGDNFYGGIPDVDLHLCCLRFRFHNTLTKKPQELQLPPKFLPSWVLPQAIHSTTAA
jgi:23S rRNA pseudouridine1911/1915/1917 synthase